MAVNVGAVATPEELVVTAGLPENVPLAPEPGAMKVTEMLLVGFPNESLTVACSGVANAVLTAALCGVPAVAVIETAAPAVLVSKKLAGPGDPTIAAVTE